MGERLDVAPCGSVDFSSPEKCFSSFHLLGAIAAASTLSCYIEFLLRFRYLRAGLLFLQLFSMHALFFTSNKKGNERGKREIVPSPS